MHQRIRSADGGRPEFEGSSNSWPHASPPGTTADCVVPQWTQAAAHWTTGDVFVTSSRRRGETQSLHTEVPFHQLFYAASPSSPLLLLRCSPFHVVLVPPSLPRRPPPPPPFVLSNWFLSCSAAPADPLLHLDTHYVLRRILSAIPPLLPAPSILALGFASRQLSLLVLLLSQPRESPSESSSHLQLAGASSRLSFTVFSIHHGRF